MVNEETGSREILDSALAALNRTTGLAGVALEERRPAGNARADAFVKIPVDRGARRFVVEIKNVDRFQTPAQVKAQLQTYDELPLLVAPYISRQIAEYCRDLHLSFIDTAGNAYLKAPGLYIYVTGQPRPKDVTPSRFPALGTAGLQVIFALLSRPELVRSSYREIARAAGAALGSITMVMGDLETRGSLTGTRDERSLLDPRRLLEEWVTHYPTTLRPKLRPRRFEGREERLERVELKPLGAYWGGEPAAERLTHYLKPASYTIYSRPPTKRLVAALHLRTSHLGNVELLDAFWNFERDRKYSDLVPAVLAYADLLATRDGRNVEAAKLIYEQHIEPGFQALHTAK